jgi:hypothetical protein
MPRTTIDIDAPLLRDLKRLQKRERKSLGRLVSDLLAQALKPGAAHAAARGEFTWVSRPMGAKVDLADKEAVRALLDRR